MVQAGLWANHTGNQCLKKGNVFNEGKLSVREREGKKRDERISLTGRSKKEEK